MIGSIHICSAILIPITDIFFYLLQSLMLICPFIVTRSLSYINFCHLIIQLFSNICVALVLTTRKKTSYFPPN